MSRPLWFVELLKKAFPGQRLAAEATKVSVVGAVVERLVFDGDDLLYLPRDGVIPINQSPGAPDDVVLPSQVVEHFIQQANYHWVMNTCLCREASQCDDYPIDLGCLFLGEAALGINPRLGRRVTREEALEHVRCCRAAGLVHLIGRNRLDTLWLGIGPGSQLMTICNCCPCCCLWRMLPHFSRTISAKVSRMPGVRVGVGDRCVGCGTCTRAVCFVDAIRVIDGQAVIGQDCRGCGRCVSVCPRGAIELTVEDDWFVRQAIARLTPLVDLR